MSKSCSSQLKCKRINFNTCVHPVQNSQISRKKKCTPKLFVHNFQSGIYFHFFFYWKVFESLVRIPNSFLTVYFQIRISNTKVLFTRPPLSGLICVHSFRVTYSRYPRWNYIVYNMFGIRYIIVANTKLTHMVTEWFFSLPHSDQSATKMCSIIIIKNKKKQTNKQFVWVLSIFYYRQRGLLVLYNINRDSCTKRIAVQTFTIDPVADLTNVSEQKDILDSQWT